MDTKATFEELEAGLAPEPTPTRRQRRGRKFVKALGLSALLFWGFSRIGHVDQPEFFAKDVSMPWPIPSDLTIGHCADWSDGAEVEDEHHEYPYSSDASFDLPLSAEALFLISRSARRHGRHGGHGGPLPVGRINYTQSAEVSDSVKVDVRVYYWREEVLNAAKVCLLERDDNESGVGIFTKWDTDDHDHRHHHDDDDDHNHDRRHNQLRFDVNVTFPLGSDESSLAINKFATDLQIFAQRFGDLHNVFFDTLDLKSTLGPIIGEALRARDATIATTLGPVKLRSLTADSADIRTTMGPIEGIFNASTSLTLETVNSPILVHVNLLNEADHEATKLSMHTTNAPVRGTITLLSPDEDSDPDSAFDVSAESTNGRVHLDVLAAPADSTVRLRAATTIGAVQVKLPATYEGSFSAATSLGRISLAVDDETEDPAGRGRKRQVESVVERNGRAVHGSVAWADEGKGRGNVDVKTTLAPISLQF